MKSSKVNPAVVSIVPSFNVTASAMASAFQRLDAASVKASHAIIQGIQKYLDSAAVAGVPRDNAGAKALGAEIRGCQVMLDAVATGTFEKKTITEYAQGAMRAYFHNVAYTPTLKNDPEFKIPGADGVVKAVTAGGKVQSTTEEAAYKTLYKALSQLRMLGRDDDAAGLLDYCLDNFKGFEEPAAA